MKNYAIYPDLETENEPEDESEIENVFSDEDSLKTFTRFTTTFKRNLIIKQVNSEYVRDKL
jgi:hypothetical protein